MRSTNGHTMQKRASSPNGAWRRLIIFSTAAAASRRRGSRWLLRLREGSQAHLICRTALRSLKLI